ncbi:MAG: SDR family oxidoreductase [Anaerolineae bacterium]
MIISEQSMQGMRVIVTAAGTGIGRTIADAFVAQGARVHICDVVADRLAAVETAVPAITTTLTDVSQPEQVDTLFAEAISHLGGLDVLVNNAGIAGPTTPVEDVTPAEWEQTLAMELGEFGIRVNAICPGAVDGPRMDRVIAAEAAAQNVPSEQVRQGYLQQVSLRTFINRRDIANLILFLCSPAGAKISGQALSVDGHTETLRM